ncbi:MAG: uroporphyrinogen III methylase [Gammaproteobacteria bacterium]|nr:uroporphyrinogen III methylase [Gammaproteobacteria bacterium]
MNKKNSLVLVGSGIKFLSHMTMETKAYIKQADHVLYLVNEPLMKEWIQKTNFNSESLDDLYKKFQLRIECYEAITNFILEKVRKGSHVCVVFYGHPTVFAKPGLDAACLAKKEGYDVRILPGVSTEDCLFADLLIDPSSCGKQSFEATDFLIYRRKFDPCSHLILWQADVIGAVNNPEYFNNEIGIKLLYNYLRTYYESAHKIILYEAAQYPGFAPKIETYTLRELAKIKLTSISTLYFPPLPKTPYDYPIAKALNLI